MMNKPKLIRITTVPISLKILLKGQLKWMSSYFEVVGVSSSGEEVQEVRDREGIRVETVEMSRKITPIQDLISLWKMIQLLKKEKPQIVHTHTPKAGIIGILAARILRIPVRMHTVAGLPLMEESGNKRRILNFVEKLTYRCATHIYPNSQGLYDFILKEKLASQAKVKIIGQGSSNGIDTSYFSPDQVSESDKKQLKSDLGIDEKDFVFVFVGRIVKDKGINELIQSFASIEFKSRHAKLLLVGPMEPELDPLLPETLKEIQTNSRIISVGYQNEVRAYFAISDALVFPSYREGFPNVVMQAGAMGLPCIVSNINGCNEIILSDQNGQIIPVKNVAAIQIAMEKFLSNESYFLSLKNTTRSKIQSRYEQILIWEALLKEYQEILDKNPHFE